MELVPPPAGALPADHPDVILARLRASTPRYQKGKREFDELRDEWQADIAAAVDAGIPNKVVARAAGVTPPRICAIVARVYSGLAEAS